MSESSTEIYKAYESIYHEFFTSARRDSPKVPAILMRYVERNIKRFYEGFAFASTHVIFTHQNSWNITYTFLGELYSDLKEKNLKKTEWVKFTKGKNEIEIDYDGSEIFYCLMLVWGRMLKKKVGTLDGFGFPKWFKEERYDLFEKDLRCIIRKEKNRKGIMYGRRPAVPFFKTQTDVIKFLKGRVNDKKILQVIDICTQMSPGWTRQKGFRNLQEFNGSFEQMKDWLIKSTGDLKKKRITEGTIKKYLMYLGLMGTIQTRVDRPLEINAAKEMILFPFYKVLRNASMSLGYLGAFDTTFCPNVRSKSFIIKIMCRAPKVDKNKILLNTIEIKYWEIVDLREKREYASSLSYQSHEYLRDRCILFQKGLDQDHLLSKNRKLQYIAREFGHKHGKNWVNEKWREFNINARVRQNFHVHKTEFNAKYSTARVYFWPEEMRMAS